LCYEKRGGRRSGVGPRVHNWRKIIYHDFRLKGVKKGLNVGKKIRCCLGKELKRDLGVMGVYG